MKVKTTLAIIFTVGIFSACTSTGVHNFQEDTILSTLNDSPRPDWADEGQPFKVKDGKVFSVGIAEILGDERPSAGMRVAENNARANVAKAVENRMEFVFQNAEEGLSYDSSAAHFIGSEMSSITSSDMRNEGNWWKRYAQSQEDSSRVIRYKIYSLITMDEKAFKKAVQAAIRKGSKQGKLSEDFQNKVNQQWDRFVEGENSQPKESVSE